MNNISVDIICEILKYLNNNAIYRYHILSIINKHWYHCSNNISIWKALCDYKGLNLNTNPLFESIKNCVVIITLVNRQLSIKRTHLLTELIENNCNDFTLLINDNKVLMEQCLSYTDSKTNIVTKIYSNTCNDLLRTSLRTCLHNIERKDNKKFKLCTTDHNIEAHERLREILFDIYDIVTLYPGT